MTFVYGLEFRWIYKFQFLCFFKIIRNIIDNEKLQTLKWKVGNTDWATVWLSIGQEPWSRLISKNIDIEIYMNIVIRANRHLN